MAFRDIVELNLEDNPAQLLRALGLASKQFEKVKQNIMIRIISRPEIQMIVLEFRRGEGLYYGEIKRRDTESYRQTQEQRSQISGESTRGDQDRPEKPEIGRDDGVFVSEVPQSEWGIEQLLRSSIAK